VNDYVQTIDDVAHQKPRSGLVRRLVRARKDSVKQRARQWLTAMDDQRLLEFGLSRQDIADLRGIPIRIGGDRAGVGGR
jgi:uncharacterized protein YjiS (DUF1127 family)